MPSDVKVTEAQYEMLVFLAEHPSRSINLNQSTLRVLRRLGLVGLIADPRPSPGTTKKLVTLSDLGRAAIKKGNE